VRVCRRLAGWVESPAMTGCLLAGIVGWLGLSFHSGGGREATPGSCQAGGHGSRARTAAPQRGPATCSAQRGPRSCLVGLLNWLGRMVCSCGRARAAISGKEWVWGVIREEASARGPCIRPLSAL
jgi:hypothetical protein